jgi:cytochrome c-type biogenesis protein CcmH/NrfG
VDAYAKYLELRPDDAAVWMQLGHCHKENGDLAHAEQYYLKSIALRPDNADTLLHLGRLKLALNDPDASEAYLRRAAALPSPVVDAAKELQALVTKPTAAVIWAGDQARDEKRWAGAVASYRKYLELRPDDAAIWVQLGHSQKESGDFAGAEASYLKNLALEPGNPDALLHLGRVKLCLNELDAAKAYFRRAVAVPSPISDAAKELGELDGLDAVERDANASSAKGARSGPDAIDAYKKLLKFKPYAPNLWAQLGHAYYACADYAEAEKAYAQALSLRPDDVDILLAHGRVKRSLQAWADADFCFQRAAALLLQSSKAAKAAGTP